MNNKLSQNEKRLHRKVRIRAKMIGTAKIPRVSIFRSLSNLRYQVVNDEVGKTLLSGDLKELKVKNNIAGAKELGKSLAGKCAEKKITAIVFDRSGYQYHGKVRALAEGAREGGLKF